MSNLSIICNKTNDTLPIIDGEYYSPELVFNFYYIGNETANNYIIDWMELVWSGYFAFFFGILGSQLKRCNQLVMQLRVFGFYGIWTGIRSNPGFVDAVIFESLLRCILSAGLAAIISLMIKAEKVVELYTILTLGSGHLFNAFDPYLRRQADCEDIGPPTKEFPYGVWVDCGNWKFAYAVTWINSLFVYLMCGIFLILVKFCKMKAPCIKPLKRMSGNVAVSMIATNSGCTFITSLKRRQKIHDELFDTFVQWSYYILLASFFLVQELIDCVWKCREKRRLKETSLSVMDISSLVRSKTWSLQSYCCCAVKVVSMIFWGLTMPLYLPDQALKWIIRKILKKNTKSLDKEDQKNRPSEREIAVEEYWMKVTEGQKNKSTEVEMVAGGPWSAEAKPESTIKVTKLGKNGLEIKKILEDDVDTEL